MPPARGSEAMSSLLRFLAFNLTAGFVLGLAVGTGFLLSNGNAALFAEEPLATAMLLWAFGASFGMGVLGTGLAMPPE